MADLHDSGNTDGRQVEGVDGFQFHPHGERHTMGWVFHLSQHAEIIGSKRQGEISLAQHSICIQL